MLKKIYFFLASLLFVIPLLLDISSASELEDQLNQTAIPYIKYFKDRALDNTPSSDGYVFAGLTRSFQLYLGGHDPAAEAVINYGAAAYDQAILAGISLAGNNTTIMDTYVNYNNIISNPNNPVLNCNGNYYDGNYTPILYGPYRVVRILGRDISYWWNSWDWVVDTGAAACLIIDASQAYQKFGNVSYKNLAILLGSYILKLQDTDGGFRYGPRGMYHDSGTDFYWNLKSTEQNERILYAFTALYEITGNTQYSQKADQIKNWLKGMYDSTVHLYHSAATFNGSVWVKSDFGYVATDVMALAPFSMMFEDTFFGATQQDRDNEVDNMFAAIESRTAFLDGNGKPKLFRFSVSQTGDYGSVEWSSQMALAYLKVAQIYNARADITKTQEYLDKYNALVSSLEKYFTVPAGDPNAKVAPYASYLDGSVAGGVPTGTGYMTYNCQAALASVYYAFAKAGYQPCELGGGPGIPQVNTALNMNVPWYQNTVYNSTGAAVSQMIINYIRQGAGESNLTQSEIYEYAKSPLPFGPELNPVEVDKALGHFDPYDYLVSNWSNYYNSLIDGNPYKGYNFSIDTYNPVSDPEAINKYMRDICHWMAYTVTKEDWWRDGELVARPNTPAAIPIYGTYNHWVVVKGYATDINPCPNPHTNPFNFPDFTVYGFWIKDPLTNGIGKDTYKTADECQSTYFLTLNTTDGYNGRFLQVAEPPPEISEAKIKIPRPAADLGNFEFLSIETNNSKDSAYLLKAQAIQGKPSKKKLNWRDIVEPHLLLDPDAIEAFQGTRNGKPILVKRPDKEDNDYYLVPFLKYDKKSKRFLTSAVIIIDASDGHFKEASWTQKPEVFLKVSRWQAIRLIKDYIEEYFYNNLKALPKRPIQNYYKEYRHLSLDCEKLTGYINNSKAELLWQVNGYSQSPYSPYWKIDANGYIWYVTQEGKVIPQTRIEAVFEEIKDNRMIIENSSAKQNDFRHILSHQ